MAEFTKGPWKAHPASSVVGSLISYGDLTKGENVCAVMPQKDKAQTEANAHLIAAAPELLAALEYLLAGFSPLLRKCLNDDMTERVEKAERVIREARGMEEKDG